MRVKVGAGWRNNKFRFKQLNHGWLKPLRQYVKIGNVWSRFYEDPNAMVENFESGNNFTLGALQVSRRAGSAYKGSYGLSAFGTDSILRSKLSGNVLTARDGVYRYETMVRPVESTHSGSLVGIAFCGGSADPADVYVALIDTRNSDHGKDKLSELGFQLRYGTDWNNILAGVNQPISFGQWYRIAVTHNQDTGLIVATVEDDTGVQLNRLSVSDTRLKGGHFGIFTVGAGDFDNVSRERIG